MQLLSLIVAYGKNYVIGFENRMPWHLPNDLAYFKKQTLGKSIVMGRKTFESLGRPLPGRKNIVITSNKHFQAEGVTVFHSLSELLRQLKEGNEETMIIGGATIYEQALPYVDKMYVTYIDHAFTGDTFFPQVNEAKWELVCEEKGLKDEKNRYDYYFRIYVRKR